MSDPTKPSRKPWRLWILQLVLVAQLVVAAVRIVNSLVVVRTQPFQFSWSLLVETLVIVAVTVVLLLALQRWLRRAEIVAPAAGSFWWLHGLYNAIQSIGSHAPPDLKGVLFENVPTASEVLGVVVVDGLLLILVGSHRLWVESYFRRWGVEDETRGAKQLSGLENLRVLNWDSICNIVALSAVTTGVLALLQVDAPRRAARLARAAPIDGPVPAYALYRIWLTVTSLLQGHSITGQSRASPHLPHRRSREWGLAIGTIDRQCLGVRGASVPLARRPACRPERQWPFSHPPSQP